MRHIFFNLSTPAPQHPAYAGLGNARAMNVTKATDTPVGGRGASRARWRVRRLPAVEPHPHHANAQAAQRAKAQWIARAMVDARVWSSRPVGWSGHRCGRRRAVAVRQGPSHHG